MFRSPSAQIVLRGVERNHEQELIIISIDNCWPFSASTFTAMWPDALSLLRAHSPQPASTLFRTSSTVQSNSSVINFDNARRMRRQRIFGDSVSFATSRRTVWLFQTVLVRLKRLLTLKNFSAKKGKDSKWKYSWILNVAEKFCHKNVNSGKTSNKKLIKH